MVWPAHMTCVLGQASLRNHTVKVIDSSLQTTRGLKCLWNDESLWCGWVLMWINVVMCSVWICTEAPDWPVNRLFMWIEKAFKFPISNGFLLVTVHFSPSPYCTRHSTPHFVTDPSSVLWAPMSLYHYQQLNNPHKCFFPKSLQWRTTSQERKVDRNTSAESNLTHWWMKKNAPQLHKKKYWNHLKQGQTANFQLNEVVLFPMLRMQKSYHIIIELNEWERDLRS